MSRAKRPSVTTELLRYDLTDMLVTTTVNFDGHSLMPMPCTVCMITGAEYASTTQGREMSIRPMRICWVVRATCAYLCAHAQTDPPSMLAFVRSVYHLYTVLHDIPDPTLEHCFVLRFQWFPMVFWR